MFSVLSVCSDTFTLLKSMLVIQLLRFFFFKQKTAYEVRISDWSSDVCSSDLRHIDDRHVRADVSQQLCPRPCLLQPDADVDGGLYGRRHGDRHARSEEHTSELQSLMRISYAVFCLKKKTITPSLQRKQQVSLPTTLIDLIESSNQTVQLN